MLRILLGAVLALVTTLGLLLLMHSLIATDEVNIDQKPTRKLADIVMPKKQIKAQLTQREIEKPQEPDEPPPPASQPQSMDNDVEMDAVSFNVKVKADINISAGPGLSASDGEYLPIVKVAPVYPRRAQSRGVQGYCIVEYTVGKTGATSNIEAVDCQPKGFFERASVKAAEKFKYKPRVVDGEPIEVVGVQNRFTFALED